MLELEVEVEALEIERSEDAVDFAIFKAKRCGERRRAATRAAAVVPTPPPSPPDIEPDIMKTPPSTPHAASPPGAPLRPVRYAQYVPMPEPLRMLRDCGAVMLDANSTPAPPHWTPPTTIVAVPTLYNLPPTAGIDTNVEGWQRFGGDSEKSTASLDRTVMSAWNDSNRTQREDESSAQSSMLGCNSLPDVDIDEDDWTRSWMRSGRMDEILPSGSPPPSLPPSPTGEELALDDLLDLTTEGDGSAGGELQQSTVDEAMADETMVEIVEATAVKIKLHTHANSSSTSPTQPKEIYGQLRIDPEGIWARAEQTSKRLSSQRETIVALQAQVARQSSARSAAVDDYHKKLRAVGAEAAAYQAAVQACHDTERAQAARLREVRSANERLINKLTVEEAEHNFTSDELVECQVNLKSAEKKLEAADKKAIVSGRAMVKLEQRLEAAKKNLEHGEEALRRCRLQLSKEKADLATERADKAKLRDERNHLEDLVYEQQVEIDEHKLEIEKLEQAVTTLKQSITEKATQINNLESRLRQSEADKQLLQSEVDALKAKVTKLENTIEKLNERVRNGRKRERKLMHTSNVAAENVGQRMSVRFKARMGLRPNEGIPAANLPPTASPGSQQKHFERQVRYVAAAAKGRGADVLLKAIEKANGLEQVKEMANMKPFIDISRDHVESSLMVIQKRLDKRHGLFLMLFLDLSRSKWDVMRNATSFYYNEATDTHEKLAVWVNPNDPKDVLYAPTLATRYSIEQERDAQFIDSNVEVAEDGRSCSRDLILCAAATYARYWPAMRSNISDERPAQVILFADATGGWRGSAITCVEVGVGDWAAGKSCSKLLLDPLAMAEGKDSYDNLKVIFGRGLASSANKLIADKCLKFETIDGEEKTIPSKLFVSGDVQMHKAITAQGSSTHAVWCFCDEPDQVPEDGREFNVYDDLVGWWGEIGCKLKTNADLYALSHLSYELKLGKPFKPFKCNQRGCGWSCRSKAALDKEMAAYLALPEIDRKAKDLLHMQDHCKKMLFAPPITDLDLIDHVADPLHLVKINMFKQMLRGTWFSKLSDEMMVVAENYLKLVGFPIKVKPAEGEPPFASWIGRDQDKFITEADLHLPHLLMMAYAPESAGAAARAVVAAAAQKTGGGKGDVCGHAGDDWC